MNRNLWTRNDMLDGVTNDRNEKGKKKKNIINTYIDSNSNANAAFPTTQKTFVDEYE